MFSRLPPRQFNWWISHYCIMVAVFMFGITNLLDLFVFYYVFVCSEKKESLSIVT